MMLLSAIQQTWVPHWDCVYHHIFLGIDTTSGLEVIGLPFHESKFLPDQPESLVVHGAHVDVLARSTLVKLSVREDACDFHF